MSVLLAFALILVALLVVSYLAAGTLVTLMYVDTHESLGLPISKSDKLSIFFYWPVVVFNTPL